MQEKKKINMFTAGAVVLGWFAKGSDYGINPMVRAFSIAFEHSYGFMLSTYCNNYNKKGIIPTISVENVRIREYN